MCVPGNWVSDRVERTYIDPCWSTILLFDIPYWRNYLNALNQSRFYFCNLPPLIVVPDSTSYTGELCNLSSWLDRFKRSDCPRLVFSLMFMLDWCVYKSVHCMRLGISMSLIASHIFTCDPIWLTSYTSMTVLLARFSDIRISQHQEVWICPARMRPIRISRFQSQC